jgi:hypothetical protein
MSGKKAKKNAQLVAGSAMPESLPPAPALPGFDPKPLSDSVAAALPKAQAASRRLASLCQELVALAVPDLSRELATTDAGTSIAVAADRLSGELPILLTDLEALARRLREWREIEQRSRRARFAEAAAAIGWAMAGNWPEPVVQQAVFIVIDEARDSATVNGLPLGGAPTADRLIAAAAAELAIVEKERSKPEDFVAELRKAYATAGGEPGRGVGVFDILRTMLWLKQSKRFQRDPRRDTFRPYSLAQFRADLTHYLASGAPPVFQGNISYRLEIAAGSFAQDGLFMFLPQTGRLGTCGRITFQPIQADDAHDR